VFLVWGVDIHARWVYNQLRLKNGGKKLSNPNKTDSMWSKALNWYWDYQADIAVGLSLGILLESVGLGLVIAAILAWRIKSLPR
tara:strand:+ start:53 stop:304 length:252 start_codon:yes stop_codon:yes gene_type:complete